MKKTQLTTRSAFPLPTSSFYIHPSTFACRKVATHHIPDGHVVVIRSPDAAIQLTSLTANHRSSLANPKPILLPFSIQHSTFFLLHSPPESCPSVVQTVQALGCRFKPPEARPEAFRQRRADVFEALRQQRFVRRSFGRQGFEVPPVPWPQHGCRCAIGPAKVAIGRPHSPSREPGNQGPPRFPASR